MKRWWLLLPVVVVILIVAQTCVFPGLISAPTGTPTVGINAPTPVAPAPVAASSPTPAATARADGVPTPEEMARTLDTTERPGRDMYDLFKRLKAAPGQEITKVVNTTQPNYSAGRKDTFYIADQQNQRYFTITATLQLVTPHAYFYVQDGEPISQNNLKAAGETFENTIYPTVHKYFGSEWSPGVDNDVHITILHARIAEAGYFSSADEYPKQMNPYSNEREMIYINSLSVPPGSDYYNGVLAHEFQHMVHWNVKQNDDTWVNEGAAELAMHLAGYDTGGLDRTFLSNPDTQLDSWGEDPGSSAAHYGAAYLFIGYLAERVGGYEAVKDIMVAPGTGVQAIDGYLRTKGLTFDEVFADWVVANYLDDPQLHGGRYGYSDLDTRGIRMERVTQPGNRTGTVRQLGADYIELAPPAGDYTLTFAGNPTVKVVPNDAHSGEMQWWANRGDVMDTTLTRSFDLTGVQKATLQFWAWYDIEKSFDFAYVMVSDDGGQTWKTLETESATASNPLGTNLGSGYTGESGGGNGPVWVHESVDLSAYAGRSILLRFEYVTDDAVSLEGFCVDDIAIPEIGFIDNVETSAEWDAKGFVRLRNQVPQEFSVHLITEGAQTTVQTVPIDATGKGQATLRGLGKDAQATLVIAGMTPTTQVGEYSFDLAPAR